MRHLQRRRVLQAGGLMVLLAGLGLWSLMGSSPTALAGAKPKRTPTPTATVSAAPTPTATPTATATPSPTPTPVPVTGTWQVVPSPAIDVSSSTFGARLNAVAVVSANDIWSVVPNPGQTALQGVTAVAANDVWAVGTPAAGGGDIIERWDGTAWSTVAAPIANANGGGISLRAVTAVSATDIWAVGDQENPLIGEGGTSDSVTEHWDGTAWTVVGLALQDSTLYGVTAPGPADAWAVDGGAMRTQHWDGATWSVVSTPNPGTSSGLQGVAAVSSGDVWAVGWTNTNGVWTPLIEHFTQA